MKENDRIGEEKEGLEQMMDQIDHEDELTELSELKM